MWEKNGYGRKMEKTRAAARFCLRGREEAAKGRAFARGVDKGARLCYTYKEKIAERGTHAQLLQKGGVYAEMVRRGEPAEGAAK